MVGKYLRRIGFYLLTAILFFSQSSQAQANDEETRGTDSYSLYQENPVMNAFTGGMGITVFDDEVYYNLYLAPELVLGKVGIGFDVNLRIGTDGKLRKEDWDDDVSSYLRLIRYVRYGNKFDSLYVRVGQLEATRLGHGSLMYMYRNNGSYDTRKIGLEFDMDFAKWGFESMVSDLTSFDLVGVRGYMRPLLESNLPIIDQLEVGASLVSDFRDNTNLVATTQSLRSAYSENGQIAFNPSLANRESSLMAWSVDLGLPLIRLPILEIEGYMDYAKIVDYGSGGLIGLSASLKNITSIATFSARLEHRVAGDQFQFSYFDALYEQDRFETIQNFGDSSVVRTRANELANYTSPGPGVYGDLGATILSSIRLWGSYQRLYNTKQSGQLHLSAGLKELIPQVLLKADYYKRDVGSETEVFTLDDRSLALVEFGYYPQPYMLLSIIYQWTYLPVRNGDEVIGYEPIRRIEPRVSLNFQF
ncbi:hypothetical protein Ctha_0299 [Chloroherpeton thalassium ATCC 35110]|uniref:Alginate export domain-containing protein n=1 Tax=Chloroherpeton thalassium (strain ATCC 35110 / GB-78) TaxID=517418 RepID=B3QTM4_CHLT3|nr:hypothetical protein [Chloroherpeton thalassium]ACF12770.1 hypothetical protein Ctha_0299 [Chloroherpeton thalassium ATCC 35110]